MEQPFLLRLVSIDYYMSSPIAGVDACFSQLEGGTAVERVPVIRIFGTTPGGQKACLHLHKVPSSDMPIMTQAMADHKSVLQGSSREAPLFSFPS